MTVYLLTGDCLDVLPTLPEKVFHTCVTSPPYFGLRDYGTAKWDGGDPECDHLGEPFRTRANVNTNTGRAPDKKNTEGRQPMGQVCAKCGARRIDSQLGLEPTPDEFVAALVAVFREVRRVLRDDGTVWLNMGDSYASGGRSTWRSDASENKGQDVQNGMARPAQPPGLKVKDLIGIPWRVAFALQADGWYLRQDIIWAKPNPMPESVRDRCTKAHEYLFLLSKRPRYYFDHEAMKEPAVAKPQKRLTSTADQPKGANRAHTSGLHNPTCQGGTSTTRNRRSVWTVTTKPFKEAHFATFPPDLIEPCILAGCPAQCCGECGAPYARQTEKGEVDKEWQRRCGGDSTGGYSGEATKDYQSAGAQNASDVKRRILEGMRPKITTGFVATCDCGADPVPGEVLDPFAGAGTTGLVARRLGRDATLIELNPDYNDMAEKRIEKDAKTQK